MAKSKKKPNAPNIAFIERIEIQIKDRKRQSMLKRAPKPAGANTADILNQQYLLQRTLAQRVQPQSQQQSQTVNVYLSDVSKLQQQETLKRIDEDASAAILRQERGGINQERLDFVLSSLLEQKREVKKQQPPPQSFDYGFVDAPIAQISERAASIAALERMNKSRGPPIPESFNVAPRSEISAAPATSTARRSLSAVERHNITVEASERASTLSKLTAQEFTEKFPDLTSEILRESKAVAEGKYKKRQSELKAEIKAGRISADEAAEQLSGFARVLGIERKPRFKSAALEPTPATSLTPEQASSFPKTAAVLKKSAVSTAEMQSQIALNVTPTVSIEQIPTAEGGQSQQLRDVQAQKLRTSGGRARQTQLLQPTQQTLTQMFKQSSAAADNLVEAGGSSPIATPPPSRPTTAESQRAAAVKRQPKADGPGQLPNLGGI